MSEIKGEFTGTWIPAHIMLDKDLTSNAKIIYATIAGFNECYMSSANLGNLAGVSERGTQKILTQLKAKKYIKQVAFDGRIRTLVAVRDQQGSTELSFAPEPTLSSPYNKYNNKTNNNTMSVSPKKPTKTNTTSKEKDSLLQELHKTLGGTRPLRALTDYRRQLDKRLKEFRPDELRMAARGMFGHDKLCGRTADNSTNYATLEYLLRNDKNVEKYLDPQYHKAEASYDLEKMEANKQKMKEVEYA